MSSYLISVRVWLYASQTDSIYDGWKTKDQNIEVSKNTIPKMNMMRQMKDTNSQNESLWKDTYSSRAPTDPPFPLSSDVFDLSVFDIFLSLTCNRTDLIYLIRIFLSKHLDLASTICSLFRMEYYYRYKNVGNKSSMMKDLFRSIG